MEIASLLFFKTTKEQRLLLFNLHFTQTSVQIKQGKEFFRD